MRRCPARGEVYEVRAAGRQTTYRIKRKATGADVAARQPGRHQALPSQPGHSWAICTRPPTRSPHPSAAPSRRSVSLSADSGDPSDSPKLARHCCTEEVPLDGQEPLGLPEWLPVWLSESRSQSHSRVPGVQHPYDLHRFGRTRNSSLGNLLGCKRSKVILQDRNML